MRSFVEYKNLGRPTLVQIGPVEERGVLARWFPPHMGKKIFRIEEVINFLVAWRMNNEEGQEPTIVTFKSLLPVGYRSDGPSIPWWSRWLLPSTGEWFRSGFIHDNLYDNAVLSRSQCDWVFRWIMRKDGVSLGRRYLIWACVRIGARKRYARNQAAEAA